MNLSEISRKLSATDVNLFPKTSLGFGLPNSLLLKWQSAGNDFHGKIPLDCEHSSDVLIIWWLYDSWGTFSDADLLTADYLLQLGPFYDSEGADESDRLPYDWLISLFNARRDFTGPRFDVELPSSLVLVRKKELDFQSWIATTERIVESHPVLGHLLFKRIFEFMITVMPGIPADGVVPPLHLFGMIHNSRPDLQALFDIQTLDGFHGFLDWVLDQGVVEYRLVLTVLLEWLQPTGIVEDSHYLGEGCLPPALVQSAIGLKADLEFVTGLGDAASQDNWFGWWLRSARCLEGRDPPSELRMGIVRKLRGLWFHANFGVSPKSRPCRIPRHLRRLLESNADMKAEYEVESGPGIDAFLDWWEQQGYLDHPSFRILHDEFLFAPTLGVEQDVDFPITNSLLHATISGDQLVASFALSTSHGRLNIAALLNDLWNASRLSRLERQLAKYTGTIRNFHESLCLAARLIISNELLPRPAGSHGDWWRVEQRKRIHLIGYGSFCLVVHPDVRPQYAAEPSRVDVEIVGFPRAESGQGEDARTVFSSLQQTSDLTLGLFHTRRWLPTPNQAAQSVEAFISPNLQAARVRIFTLSGFDMLAEERFEGLAAFCAEYLVGYWPWELSRWPGRATLPPLIVDEIWSSTRYIQRSLAAITDKPVIHMPLPVDIDEAGLPGRDALPELSRDRFNFVFVFDGFSYFERKNPLAVIRAFQQAFPKTRRDDVGLTIKAMNAENFPILLALKMFADEDKRITVIYETWDKPQVMQLIKSADALVSLHRSEGFGRIMAEAMLLGTPVIASDYSGNRDFCTADTAFLVGGQLKPVLPDQYIFWPEQQWFDPSIDEAVAHMRTVFDRPHTSITKIEAARSNIAKNYSLDACGRRYTARISEIMKLT